MFQLLLFIWFLLGTATTANPVSGAVGLNQTASATTTQADDTCGIPEYASIKAQLLQNYDVFDSFYRLPRIAEASRLQHQDISPSTAFLDDTAVCAMLQREPIGVEGRDPCPGAWELTRDPNRVPCLRREFRCHCPNCLLPSQAGDSSYNRQQCKPIYNYIPVMRKLRNPLTNTDQWTYTLDPVVIGCTCAQRNTAVSARN